MPLRKLEVKWSAHQAECLICLTVVSHDRFIRIANLEFRCKYVQRIEKCYEILRS